MIKAATLRRHLSEWTEELERIPQVNAVGLGDDPERGYVVVVEVEKETHDLPSHVDCDGQQVPVVTRYMPMSAFKMADDTVDGSDRLIASQINRAGTLALVFSETSGNRLFGLTNAHVVTVPDGNSVGDSVSIKLDGVDTEIGHVAYHSSFRTGVVNSVDMALIELNADGRRAANTYQIQTIPGRVIGSSGLSFSRFSGAMRPHRYGGSTSNNRSVVPCFRPVEHASATLFDESGMRMRFGRVFAMQAAGPTGVQPGHSGSLVVRDAQSGGLVAAGLLAAGSGGSAVVFSMTDIANEIRRSGIDIS